MPTRFYLPSSLSTTITPAYSSEWERTADADRRGMVTFRVNSALTTKTSYENVTTAPYDFLTRQYISEPLEAQTISGYVKGQIRCYEDNAAMDYCAAIIIKIVSSDGGTVRGTLLSYFPASLSSEYATSLTNRYFPPNVAITSVNAQAGDRIVVEIGTRSFNVVSSGYNAYHRFGDAAAADLPEDESTTSDYNPWIEFSANITFINDIRVSQANAQVEYQVPSHIDVSQVFAQVEYVPTPPGQYTTQVTVTVALDPSSTAATREFTKDAAATISLDPAQTLTLFQTAGEFVAIELVTVSLTPAPVTIWDRLYTATPLIEILPEAEVSCPVRVATAEVNIEILPTPTVRMPVIGWDSLTGYGLVDFSWLSEDPPFYVVLGDIPLVIDPTAKEVSLCAEDTFDINPDLKVGGRTTVVHSKPGELLVDSQGGPAVGGEPVVEWPEIPVEDYTAKVEILLGGSSSAQHFTPSPRDMAVETRGGVRLTGSTSPTYLSPQDLITEYTTVVAAKVGPVQVPAVEFVEPGLDVDVLEVTTQVSLELSGAPLVDYPELPTVFEHETNFGKIRVGGACGVLWDYPEIFDHVAVGGIILEGQGEEAAEAFYTIALHGYTFEPSLYSNFSFNSYASHRGRMLAARDDGIYVLEGADDDGKPFHPGVRIGPTTFGLDNFKRLRFLQLGDCGDAEVRVAGKTKGKEGYYRKSRGRYEVSREVEDKIVTVEISDFTRLDQTQIDLIVLANR